MIDPMSIYGPEHYDSPYFEALKTWLSGYKFKRGAEIGFAWGMSAMAFLETQEAPLTSFDLGDAQGKHDGVKQVYGDRFQLIIGDSSTNLLKQKGTFDYIYIDGNHDYEPVKADLEAAHQKLTKGGVIVCDDYGNPCGVKQAVDEFCKSKKYRLEHMPSNPNGGVILCSTQK